MAKNCPGQDQQYWTPEDIYEIICSQCGKSIEFFKDDLKRKCPGCGHPNLNPRNDLSCAEWCSSAVDCLEEMGRPIPESLGRGTKQKK